MVNIFTCDIITCDIITCDVITCDVITCDIITENLRKQNMTFHLKELPFSLNDLEPYISAETLEYHHGKHHKSYVDNLNNLLPSANSSLEEVIMDANNVPAKAGIFNNAAQVWNHDFYWQSIGKPHTANVGGKPSGKVLQLIEQSFASYENFVEEFTGAGKTQFGSGWVWLVKQNDTLQILKTGNAYTPLTDKNNKVLLTMDVWEHAYYIDYRNKRPEYISVFLQHLVNWNFVEKQL